MKDNAQSNIADQILTALAVSDASLNEADLLETVRGRRQEKVRVLRALVESNEIRRAGSGKRGKPYCYSLPASTKELPHGDSTPYTSSSIDSAMTESTENSEPALLDSENLAAAVKMFSLFIKMRDEKSDTPTGRKSNPEEVA